MKPADPLRTPSPPSPVAALWIGDEGLRTPTAMDTKVANTTLRHSPRSMRWRLGFFFVPFSLLLLSGVLFTSTGRDDTHISVWAASSLAQSGEILNYNGQRVEQSSSLLQVVTLAAFARLGPVPLTDLARLSSILFAMACLPVVYVLAHKLHPRAANRHAGIAAMMLTSTSAYFVYWAFSGMETTLAALAGLLLIVGCGDYLEAKSLTGRTVVGAVVGIWVFISVRPESPVVLGCVLVASLAVEGIAWLSGARDARRFRRFCMLCGVSVGSVAALMLFRWGYFGQPFPQPVYAKAGGLSSPVVRSGVWYLYTHLRIDPMVGVLLASALISAAYLVWRGYRRHYELSSYIWLAVFLLVAQLSFVILTGGDWMEGGRFLVPVIPVAALLVVVGASERMTVGKVRNSVFAFLILLQCLSVVEYARVYAGGMPLWSRSNLPREFEADAYGWFERRSRVNVRDMPALFFLKSIVPRMTGRGDRKLVIMSGQMGMVAYHLAAGFPGKIMFVDRYSLTERTFTDCAFLRRQPDPRVGWSVGWGPSWKYFFENYAALADQCGIALPDVVYDLGSDWKLLGDNGYTVMFRQRGFVESTSRVFPGRLLAAEAFVAVRDDLAPLVRTQGRVEVDFGALDASLRSEGE